MSLPASISIRSPATFSILKVAIGRQLEIDAGERHFEKEFIVTPENQSLLVAEAFGLQEGW